MLRLDFSTNGVLKVLEQVFQAIDTPVILDKLLLFFFAISFVVSAMRFLPEVNTMLREIPRTLHTQQVFLSATNKPIPYWTTYVQKTWKRSLEKAGIKGACFHDLRHDFVTRAMRGGNASHIVMKQVGHKTDSMLRRYQLIDERDLLELQINPLVTTQDQKTG